MKVNGEDIKLNKVVSLLTFLEDSGYRAENVAVERNGEIVPRGSYPEVLLDERDRLEIVHFVGGG